MLASPCKPLYGSAGAQLVAWQCHRPGRCSGVRWHVCHSWELLPARGQQQQWWWCACLRRHSWQHLECALQGDRQAAANASWAAAGHAAAAVQLGCCSVAGHAPQRSGMQWRGVIRGVVCHRVCLSSSTLACPLVVWGIDRVGCSISVPYRYAAWSSAGTATWRRHHNSNAWSMPLVSAAGLQLGTGAWRCALVSASERGNA